MEIISSLDAAAGRQDIRGLALGFFDGVHRGHQRVFEAVASAGSRWAVLTFWPHPRAVLRPESAPALLTGLPHKLELLRRAGASAAIIHPFDAAFSTLEAPQFLERLFAALPALQHIGCGPNFRFGRGRLGTPAQLAAAAAGHGVQTMLPDMSHEGGEPISSSRIRTALQEGRVQDAEAMLGRPYRLRGTVVRGRRLGRQLGFPTANVATDDGFLLPPGVYAGSVLLEDGTSRRAAINLGRQPTVDPQAPPSLEAHLIGFSGELEGCWVEVEPRRFLRPQRSFGSLESLAAAIQEDVQQASGA